MPPLLDCGHNKRFNICNILIEIFQLKGGWNLLVQGMESQIFKQSYGVLENGENVAKNLYPAFLCRDYFLYFGNMTYTHGIGNFIGVLLKIGKKVHHRNFAKILLTKRII